MPDMTAALESMMARRMSRAEEPTGIWYWRPSLGASKKLMIGGRNLRRMESVVKAAKWFNHAPLSALNHFRLKPLRNAEKAYNYTIEWRK